MENYHDFKSFDKVEGSTNAILRPEFLKLTKKTEKKKYTVTIAEGIVQSVNFRGSNFEITVKYKDNIYVAIRKLDDPPVEVGEEVDIFVYRLLVLDGDKVHLLKNRALDEESVVI